MLKSARTVHIFVTGGLLLAVMGARATSLNSSGRAACYAAVEHVYYDQRDWPDKSTPRPRFEDAYPISVFLPRAEDNLRMETALESLRGKALATAEIQGEIDRMIAHSRDPATLEKVFAALANDPQRIAECIARPAMTERLLRTQYADSPTLHADERAMALQGYAQLQAGVGVVGSGASVHQVWTTADSELLAIDRLGASYVSSPKPADISQRAQRFASFASALGIAADASAETLEERVGQTSALQEHATALTAVRIEHGAQGIEVNAYTWPKRAFEDWWHERASEVVSSTRALTGAYTIATPAAGQCLIGEWVGPTKVINDYQTRESQTTDAVWTGSEMMLFGDGHYSYGGDFYAGPIVESGLRFNSSSNAWSVMSSAGAPTSLRYGNSAVEWHSAWTGSQLVVMGCAFIDGGGINCALAGGRYTPATDSWAPISLTGAVAPAKYYEPVHLTWDGSKVLVLNVTQSIYPLTSAHPFRSYDPLANTWQTLADPPATDSGGAVIRGEHAVWTGTELIALGSSGCLRANDFCGSPIKTDIYIYNLATNQWRKVTNSSPTLSDRAYASLAWTDTEAIVWGGEVPIDDGTGTNTVGAPTNTGARYNPSTNVWTAMSLTNAPVARDGPIAQWTTSAGKFVVWGGSVPPPPTVSANPTYPETGSMYSPSTNSWTTVRNTGAPMGREYGLSVWNGTEVIIWGGQECTIDSLTFEDCNNGGRFNATTNNWAPLVVRGSDGAPGNLYWNWTGMVGSGSDGLVLGGRQSYASGPSVTDGSVYHPATDDWIPVATTNSPTARMHADLGWSGGKYFVWGGTDYVTGQNLYDGALYDPVTQTWSTMTAPTIDFSHRDLYAQAGGAYLYVWGGAAIPSGTALSDGFVFDAATNSWAALPSAGAPTARCNALSTADANGKFVVWGGYDCSSTNQLTGSVYSHSANAWTPLLANGSVPSSSQAQDFVNQGAYSPALLGVLNTSDVFLWDARSANGWRYSISGNAWQQAAVSGAPLPNSYGYGQAMQVAGRDLLFFGGYSGNQYQKGLAYRPESDTWSCSCPSTVSLRHARMP